MILYNLRCSSGHRFEGAVASIHSNPPECPYCGDATMRVPAVGRLVGTADPGPSRAEMPRSWRGVNSGDRSTIAGWRELAMKREKLEHLYPELAGDRRPVQAHEGQFADRPLRVGDPLPNRNSPTEPPAGSGHPHTHIHAPTPPA